MREYIKISSSVRANRFAIAMTTPQSTPHILSVIQSYKNPLVASSNILPIVVVISLKTILYTTILTDFYHSQIIAWYMPVTDKLDDCSIIKPAICQIIAKMETFANTTICMNLKFQAYKWLVAALLSINLIFRIFIPGYSNIHFYIASHIYLPFTMEYFYSWI